MAYEFQNCHPTLRSVTAVVLSREPDARAGVVIELTQLNPNDYLQCSRIERAVFAGSEHNPSWATPRFTKTAAGYVLSSIYCGSAGGYPVVQVNAA